MTCVRFGMCVPFRHHHYKAQQLVSPFQNMLWLAGEHGSICQVYVECLGRTKEDFQALRLYKGIFIMNIINEAWYACPFLPYRSVPIQP